MRTVGSNGEATSEAIRQASLELIYEVGFEAASLRTLAKKVGVHVSSLYNYFNSKQDLLTFIIRTTFEQRLVRLEKALDGITDPREALIAFVRQAVDLHTRHKEEAVIGDRELGRLSPEIRAEVVALRDSYDRRITQILRQGIATGAFTISEPRIATFAIIGMISRVSKWHKGNGRLSEGELEELFVGYILQMVGAKVAEAVDAPPQRKARRAS